MDPPSPSPPPSFLSPLLVDFTHVDIGPLSSDHLEGGGGMEARVTAQRKFRNQVRKRERKGQAVAEGGYDDPATHSRCSSDDGSGIGMWDGVGDDDRVYDGDWSCGGDDVEGGARKVDDGVGEPSREEPFIEGTSRYDTRSGGACEDGGCTKENGNEDVQRWCDDVDEDDDGGVAGKGSGDGKGHEHEDERWWHGNVDGNGSGYRLSPLPPLLGPGREAQRMHTGGRARAQDCMRKAMRQSGAPRSCASNDNSTTTLMNLITNLATQGKSRARGLRKGRRVVADTRRPQHQTTDSIGGRCVADGGWNGGWNGPQRRCQQWLAEAAGLPSTDGANATVHPKNVVRVVPSHETTVCDVFETTEIFSYSAIEDSKCSKRHRRGLKTLPVYGFSATDKSGCAVGGCSRNSGGLDGNSVADYGCPYSGTPRVILAVGYPEQAGGSVDADGVIELSEGVHFLDLRGGGAVTEEGHPPGAGVARWLADDTALETAERNWMNGRRVHDVAHDDAVGDGHAEDEGQVVGPRLIFGTRHGVEVIICPHCAADVPRTSWPFHRCPAIGRGRVQQLVELWEERARPAEMERDDGFWTFDRGAKVEDGDPQGDGRMIEEMECRPGSVAAGSGMACGNCGIQTSVVGVEWRICNCTTIYCETCARGPCHSCGARVVWWPLAEQVNYRAQEEDGSKESEAGYVSGFIDQGGMATSDGHRGTAGTTVTPAVLADRRASQIEERM